MAQDAPAPAPEPSEPPAAADQPPAEPQSPEPASADEGERPLWLVLGWSLRLVVALVILGGGGLAFQRLAALAKPPERQETQERALRVRTITVANGPHTVQLDAYGTVGIRDRIYVSPQLGGRVIEVHPGLANGAAVAAGDLVLRLDGRDYELALALAEAEEAAYRAQLAELEIERENTERLLASRRQSVKLAEQELARTRRLVADNLATAADEDRAEQALIAEQERILSYENVLRTLPARRATIEAQIERVRRSAAVQDLNLSRCEVRAPKGGRIESYRLEVGQVVAPGEVVLTLADDRTRELHLRLEGDLASRWLRFRGEPSADGWFPAPQPVEVPIRWVDGPPAATWTGRLVRIDTYDSGNRSVRLVVAIPPELNQDPAHALVAGMFCRVTIPGRRLESVAVLPRNAIDASGHVFVVRDGRLAQLQPEIVYERGSEVLVSNLPDGAEVIVNKLVSPVLGMEVERAAEAGPGEVRPDPRSVPAPPKAPQNDTETSPPSSTGGGSSRSPNS